MTASRDIPAPERSTAGTLERVGSAGAGPLETADGAAGEVDAADPATETPELLSGFGAESRPDTGPWPDAASRPAGARCTETESWPDTERCTDTESRPDARRCTGSKS